MYENMSDTLLLQILEEMKNMSKRMGNLETEVKTTKENMNERFESMDQRFENMKEDMDQRFNQVDQVLERIETNNHEDIVGMLHLIEHKIGEKNTEILTKIDALNNENLSINRRLHRVEGIVEGLTKQ